MLFFKVSLVAGVAAGIIGGSILVLVWEKWLRAKNYGWALSNIFWTYILIYYTVTFIGGLVLHIGEFKSISDPKLWQLVISVRAEAIRHQKASGDGSQKAEQPWRRQT